ncbi:MAG: oligosaccharide flippase family protein [bacterium]
MPSRFLTKPADFVRRAVSKGAAHLFASMGVVLVLGLVQRIYLSRLFGPEVVGHFDLMLKILAVVGVLSALGMDTAILKFVAEPVDEARKQQIFFHGWVSIFLASTLMTALAMIYNQFVGFRDEVAELWLNLQLLTIPLIFLQTSAAAYFQGRKQIQVKAGLDGFRKFLDVMLVIIFTSRWGIPGFTLGYLLGEGLSFCATAYLLRGKVPRRLDWDRGLFQKMARFGAWAVAANAFSLVLQTADVLVITYLAKEGEGALLIGLYSTAALTITGMRLLPQALLQTYLPYLSERSGSPRDLKLTYQRLTLAVVGLTGGVSAVLFVFARPIIVLVFGVEFEPAARMLQFLLAGLLLWTCGAPAGITQIALGRTDINFWVAAVTGITNIVLNIVLFKLIGIYGIIYSVILSSALTCALQRVILARRLK